MNAITKTPGAANIQSHLRENLRVIRAAYDVADGDLSTTLHWFRTVQLPAFSQKTAEQAIAAGKADDVIRLISSLQAGAAG